VAMALYGIGFALLPAIGVPVAHLQYVGIIVVKGPGAGLIGLALIAAGLWVAPRLLPGYGLLARLLLGPSRGGELSVQVEHLVRTRSDTIDAGAAELRRIERDLHDGAQARLVAMGMTLDAIDQHLDANPTAARALLAEAKQSSVKALSELRDLVRGIHPPVLADRGLVDAVRALALDSPVRARVTSELAGRPPAPVESAAYFAVSELLANASKHAGPCEAWIDFRHSAGMLRITVTDDGRGGVDQELGSGKTRGTGLRGVEKRLAAFDGVLAVSSPPGGPTVANLEIPCALS
jgi:signal transduction histidine kinase